MHTTCDRSETHKLVMQAKKDKSVRFCRTCNKLLPIDQFDQRENRFFCRQHLKDVFRWYRQGTQPKRAVNNLRVRCWKDKDIFGQTKSDITCQDIRDLMTPEQLNQFSKFSVVPKDPTKPISASNALLIKSDCRKYLVACWKVTRDLAQYQQILQMPQFNFNV